MGNRFKDMPQYFSLIQAHGILAVITFLFIVPFSILFLRFYGQSPRLALRLHIWCHILAILLTTTLFILGFMVVGTRRSLSNPHHGIGVAIYILLLIEFIGGWWVYNREKKNRKPYAPLKAVVCKLEYYRSQLIRVDSQLAWSNHWSPWSHSDSPWSYPLWSTSLPFHSLLISNLLSVDPLLHSLFPRFQETWQGLQQ